MEITYDAIKKMLQNEKNEIVEDELEDKVFKDEESKEAYGDFEYKEFELEATAIFTFVSITTYDIVDGKVEILDTPDMDSSDIFWFENDEETISLSSIDFDYDLGNGKISSLNANVDLINKTFTVNDLYYFESTIVDTDENSYKEIYCRKVPGKFKGTFEIDETADQTSSNDAIVIFTFTEKPTFVTEIEKTLTGNETNNGSGLIKK